MEPSREITAASISSLVSGELVGDPERRVSHAAPLDRADERAVTFVAAAKYVPYLQATRAGVVLVTREWVDRVPAGSSAVLVDDPHAALRRVLLELYPTRALSPGIHPTAVIAGSARVHGDSSIGPFAVIGEGVEIGAGTVIGAHTVIGDGSMIGRDVHIYAQVTLYERVTVRDRVIIHSGARIGKDGFGFVWEDGHRRVPQVGRCVIEEDVEIGANTCVDRGSLGDTVVGSGTKIDNLVQLGHNVRIGHHVVLAAQVGIAGSAVVGEGAVMGGQAGVGGHLAVGAGVRVAGQSGVIGDVPPGETVSGYPARPHRDALRAQAASFRLPELIRRVRELEAAVFGRGKK